MDVEKIVCTYIPNEFGTVLVSASRSKEEERDRGLRNDP
jgi:hypothetical protein